MKAFPAFMAAAFALAGSATTVMAEQFQWDGGGNIVKEGGLWVEYPPHAGQIHFTFSELARAEGYVLLFDSSRSFILRLPLAGGPASWLTPGKDNWVVYKNVLHIP